MAQSVLQWDMDWMDEVQFLAGIRQYFLLQSTQTGFGTHLAFYPIDAAGHSPSLKQRGCEVDHTPPSSAKVKTGAVISPFPHLLMVWLYGKAIPVTGCGSP
jgi:hypothetical protein